MAIIVFQHSDRGRPGRLGATLRDHGFRLDVRRPDQGDPMPADLDNVEAVIALGGPQTAAAGGESPGWMQAELEFLKGAHDAELPVIGICLGHQMLARALGGEVARMAKPEIGYHAIELAPPGQTDTILSGIPWRAHQFCHHHDEVKTLPVGAVTLASSPGCKVQAFRVGMRTYAFQYHFEADQSMVTEFLRSDRSALEAGGLTEQSAGAQVEQHYANFSRLGDRLCVNLATYLVPAGWRMVMSSGDRPR